MLFASSLSVLTQLGRLSRRAVLSAWNSPVGPVLLHLLLVAALVSTLYCFGIIHILPSDENLIVWDAMWYQQIAREGYSYSEVRTSSAAFFPLFPYFWRLTHLGPLGMALLNVGIFNAAFAWLGHQLRLSRRWQLLALSTPMLMFMWLPYTEALFFLFSSIMLAGLHRNRLDWTLVGMFGAGLTRSASSLFTPALVLTVFVLAVAGETRRARRLGIGGVLTLVASVAIVAVMQQVQTGEPFGFIKAHKHWSHVLSWPLWPLHATTGINMLWLEALAMAVGIAAAGLCLGMVIRAKRRWAQRLSLAYPSAAVVFSLAYAVCALLFVVFFQKGNVANLARYILATPFLVVLFWQVSQLPAWPARYYAAVAAGLGLVWPIFGAYTRFPAFSLAQTLWYFGLTTAYALAYLGWRQWRYGREMVMLLYFFNLIVQLHLLESILQYYLVE
ncbi:hypothetical protein JAO73_00425 [Hymenobacter sp. BT523]|uniref:hypothetical protein n=1 Tax=Hymenobacter sp. BT523 TaxID=2795725 RepID=UPI0018EC99C9|nr:hypothetical protein [Hymenobacter sp. BT523]MBJ6107456.1 hypothetical protein [Hymenobacter sp. BT523]